MERKSTIVVGAPRRGKTFYSEQQAIAYAKRGGTAIAYNVGRPSDFRQFIGIELITPRKRQMLAREQGIIIKDRDIGTAITHFRHIDSGKIYKAEDFMKVCKGKCIKMERLNPAFQEERMFFVFIYKYLYNCLLIMDDFRAVTRNGLSSEFLQLNSRQNHTGKEYAPNENLIGVDIFFIYHSFQTVAQEMYTYTNSMVQFYTTNPPKLINDNPELFKMLNENYGQLKDAPKYARFEIDSIEYEQIYVKP